MLISNRRGLMPNLMPNLIKKSVMVSIWKVAVLETWRRSLAAMHSYLAMMHTISFDKSNSNKLWGGFLNSTLRSLLSVLFYQTTWSEFFQIVSIKRPGPSQKKSIVLFYLLTCLLSLLSNLVWIFGKIP